MSGLRGGAILVLLAGFVLAACENPVITDRTLMIDATGSVSGTVFVDADGNGTIGGGDPPFGGLRLQLVPAGGGGAVASALTDTLGVFEMDSVPVGDYRVVVDESTLPDSLRVTFMNAAPFSVGIGQSVQRSFRLSFPTFTLGEVRGLPVGQRVFTHGIVLNPRDPFGDGAVHFQEDSVYLRATQVARGILVRGDSVRILGTTSSEAGRPILTNVEHFRLVPEAILPRPVDLSSAAARTARGGALDAAFARVVNADIVDTVSVGLDLVVTVDDGSGPLEVVLREFIGFDRTAMRPGLARFTRLDGLLVPILEESGVRWRLLPRFTADVAVGAVP